MTQREFMSWVRFYREHPFSDSHRYHRPAALVSQSMANGDMEAKLEWLLGSLKPAAQVPPSGDFSPEDLKTFEALGMKLPETRN